MQHHPRNTAAILMDGKSVKGNFVLDDTGLTWSQILTGDPDAHLPTTVKTAYTRVAFYKAVVDTRAWAMSSIPWEVTRTGSETVVWDETTTPTDPFLAKIGDLVEWLYRWEQSLVLTSSAYALKRLDGGRFDGLQYFSPATVTPEYQNGWLVGFKRQTSSQTKLFIKDDVLHFFRQDPWTEQGPGASEGDGAKIHASVLESLSTFLDSYLDGGLVKATVLTTEERIPEGARQEVEAWWRRFLGGPKKASNAKVLNAKLKPEVIGEGLKDLADHQITADEKESICQAFRVPLSVVLSHAANYATASVEELGFYTRTVLPAARNVAGVLNKQLFEPARFHFEFRPEKMEVYQRYEMDKATAIQQLTGGPVLTVDEGRELLGYDPIGSDDFTSESEAKALDIKRWKAKIKSRGKRDVAFTPDALEDWEADAIRERLASDVDISAAFVLDL